MLTLDEISGVRLLEAVRTAVGPDPDRAPLYRALLDEPVCVALLGPEAPAGPAMRLEGLSEPTRLVESVSLGVPVVALYPSAAELRSDVAARKLWPDGVERAVVFQRGEVFHKLRVHPGALVATVGGGAALDAGEVAALAEQMNPTELLATLRQLIAGGRAREAARKLSTRMFYVLGHPGGSMLIFQRELPVFLHRVQAIDFADRFAEQVGRRPDLAIVAAAEIFSYALRGKLTILITPGPSALRLRYLDLR